MAARTRGGCQSCRNKHLKCDQAYPTCGRCGINGRVCIRYMTFRAHEESYSIDQPWLGIRGQLRFVDETVEVRSQYVEGNTPEVASEQAGSTPVDLPHTTNHDSEGGTPRSSHTSQAHPSEYFSDHSPVTNAPTASLARIISPTERQPETSLPRLPELSRTMSEIQTSSYAFSSIQGMDEPAPLSTPPIHSDTPIWPLTDPSEALLLRHYVQNLAVWLDLCDPKQHFQIEVPKRAGTCKILLNAIFALSARHLSRVTNYDALASNRYHDECLKYLIPMLDDASTVSDESLFAATIILRVLEEIDTPDMNSQGHRFGLKMFVIARNPYLEGGLSEAAFWVGLRQEIYIAMMHHESVQLILKDHIVDRSLQPANDYVWANRAIVHCADVLNCCFAQPGVSIPIWKELTGYNEEWQSSKPEGFIPTFFEPADKENGKAFPQIWYIQACHIIAIQHHLLARILLAIFNPQLPKIGGGRSAALREMEAKVESDLREICGIGISNEWTPPAIFTAAMGIAICGDRFKDRKDQEALLGVLVQTEKDHARPTAAVQQQMKEAWGGLGLRVEADILRNSNKLLKHKFLGELFVSALYGITTESQVTRVSVLKLDHGDYGGLKVGPLPEASIFVSGRYVHLLRRSGSGRSRNKQTKHELRKRSKDNDVSMSEEQFI